MSPIQKLLADVYGIVMRVVGADFDQEEEDASGTFLNTSKRVAKQHAQQRGKLTRKKKMSSASLSGKVRVTVEVLCPKKGESSHDDELLPRVGAKKGTEEVDGGNGGRGGDVGASGASGGGDGVRGDGVRSAIGVRCAVAGAVNVRESKVGGAEGRLRQGSGGRGSGSGRGGGSLSIQESLSHRCNMRLELGLNGLDAGVDGGSSGCIEREPAHASTTTSHPSTSSTASSSTGGTVRSRGVSHGGDGGGSVGRTRRSSRSAKAPVGFSRYVEREWGRRGVVSRCRSRLEVY